VAAALDFMVKEVLVVAAALAVAVAAEDLEALTAVPAMEVVMEAVAVVQADTIMQETEAKHHLDLVLQVLFA
jgi:hypothetical protein